MAKLRTTAAIDIGSNSLTLKIAEAKKTGPVKILETVRGTLSLGTSSYRDGEISEEQIEDLCRQLQGFKGILKLYEIPYDACPVVATSALREAANRDLVVERVRQATDFDVQILSNTEERSMHLIAVRAQLDAFEDLAKEGITVLDIGAGSLQVSAYENGHCYYSQNFLLGCLRISELFAQFELRAKDYESLIDEYISSELANSETANPNAQQHPHLVALGVDLGAIHLLREPKEEGDKVIPASELGLTKPFVKRKEFDAIFDRIRHLNPLEITHQEGIPTEIAETLLPAMIIVKQYLDASEAKGVYIPQVHICDALIYNNVRNIDRRPLLLAAEEDLIQTAKFLAERFQDDMEHSRFVTEVSQSIYRSLRNRFGFDRRFGVLLRLLGILHDIGKAISLSKHASNSVHIVKRNEFLGLNAKEKQLLEEMIRYHSGTENPALKLNPNYSNEERRIILSAIAILRVADAIDASQTQKLHSWDVKLRQDTLFIEGKCHEDFRMESWSLTDKAELFESYFNLKVRLRVEEYSI